MAIQDELKLFVEQFKLENGRIPTQNEIIKGTGRASKTIKSYLVEGVDYAKPLTKLEAARLGGQNPTGITKVNPKLVEEFKDLKVKGIGLNVQTSPAGSKSFKVTFDKKLNLKNIFLPATKENLEKIKTNISEVIDSDNYNKNILPFQTSDEKRKIRRLKEANYRKKDIHGVYKALQKYKSEKFPGSLSKDIVIQHGQPKFTTQTLSKFALIPSTVNISETVEKVERLRNNALKIALATLNNKNADVATKKAAAEKYNSIARGLRGQLKGEASGVVNFELLEVDDKGNFKKIKDIGFDSKKALVASNKDLSKITKLEAEELLKLGKKKIDIEAIKLTTPNVIVASSLKPYNNMDPTSFPSKTYVRDELKKVPITPKINKIKDIDIPTSTILKGLGKGTLRAVAPFVPFVGAVGVALGVSDVAKAKDQGLEGEELGIAYFVGPELAKKYSDYKDRNLDVESVEEEGVMGLKDGGRVGFRGGGKDASEGDFDTPDGPADNDPGSSPGEPESKREYGIMSQFTGPKGTTGDITDFSPDPAVDLSTPEQTARHMLNVDIARGVYNVKRPNIVTTALRNPLVRAGLYTINPFDYGRKVLNVFDTFENLRDLYDVATDPAIDETLEEMRE